jgi:GT2 family glycosyltransferase
MNSLKQKIDLQLKISVCICTRNRPEDLAKALNSVKHSTYPVFETIVSDDSTNELTKILVAADFPDVKYLEGPRQGLGANRNNILKHIAGSHVLFIDDDVVMADNFLEIACDRLAEHALKEPIDRVIFSGIENKNGKLVFPGEQCFLGYQNVSYQAGDRIRTVVINSAIFPRKLFEDTLFDEKLVYGNDEVDLTTRATAKGFKIVLYPEAVNFHYPSEINRDYYEPYHDSTRIYVTFKRYFDTENNKLKASLYLPYALLYATARNIKYQGISSFPNTLNTFQKSLKFIIDFLKLKTGSLN